MIARTVELLNRVCVVALFLSLTACATSATVKDITGNKIGYLTDTFVVAKLSPQIADQISKGRPPSLSFQKMNLEVIGTIENSDGKKTSANASATLLNAGGAYVQEMWEWSNNGISYSLNYKLSYASFLGLKFQSVPLNYKVAPRITEVKELKQFSSDIAKPRENTEYTFEYAVGPEIQLANFTPHQLKCRSEKFYPAKTIHPKLAGNGIDLNCEFYTNNVVSSKWKYVFLQQYGVAFLLEATNSRDKTTYKITNVEVS